MLKSFEHIGMRVNNLDDSLAFYVDLLGLELVLRKRSGDGSLAFLDAGGGMLEISAPDGGVKRALDVDDNHAGLRHITFCYDDVDGIFARLEQAGVELVQRPCPAVHVELLRRKAFVRDPDGIMIELIERRG